MIGLPADTDTTKPARRGLGGGEPPNGPAPKFHAGQFARGL